MKFQLPGLIIESKEGTQSSGYSGIVHSGGGMEAIPECRLVAENSLARFGLREKPGWSVIGSCFNAMSRQSICRKPTIVPYLVCFQKKT